MAGIGETAPSTNPLLVARGTEQTNSHVVKVLIDTGSTLGRVGERMTRVSSCKSWFPTHWKGNHSSPLKLLGVERLFSWLWGLHDFLVSQKQQSHLDSASTQQNTRICPGYGEHAVFELEFENVSPAWWCWELPEMTMAFCCKCLETTANVVMVQLTVTFFQPVVTRFLRSWLYAVPEQLPALCSHVIN